MASNITGAVVVDDYPGNPALHYVDPTNWTHLINYAGAGNGTVSFTTTNGSSIIFTFNGTSVGVAGTVLPFINGTQPPVSLYSVDGSSPVSYTAPNNGSNEATDVAFFVKNDLPAGIHTLVINVTHTEQQRPYLLDYIAYLPPQLSASASSSMSIQQSSQGYVPIPIQTNGNASSDSSHSSSTPVGAIVGGVVGGLALVVFTALGLFFFCRRRSNGVFYESTSATDMLHPEIKPLGQEAGGQAHLNQPAAVPLVAAAQTSSPSPTFNLGGPVASGALHSPQTQNGAFGKAAYIPQAQTAQFEPVWHADSGVRFASPEEPSGSSHEPVLPAMTEIPDDVPPEYTPH